MGLNTLIIDDELNARENLLFLIKDFCPELNVVGMANSADQAEVLVNQYSPDLIFLDIAMPNKNGFDFLNSFQKKDFDVIFITAHSEYALDAFKANALDYIEKPIDVDHLKRAASKALQLQISKQAIKESQEEESEEKIAIPTRNGYTFVENNKIIYFKADENYTEIFLENGKRLVSSKTIKRYEEKMNTNIFYRIHKSYIINISHHLREFNRIKGNSVLMSNGIYIPIARRRLTPFLQTINQM